jgi:hypothetical protein
MQCISKTALFDSLNGSKLSNLTRWHNIAPIFYQRFTSPFQNDEEEREKNTRLAKQFQRPNSDRLSSVEKKDLLLSKFIERQVKCLYKHFPPPVRVFLFVIYDNKTSTSSPKFFFRCGQVKERG